MDNFIRQTTYHKFVQLVFILLISQGLFGQENPGQAISSSIFQNQAIKNKYQQLDFFKDEKIIITNLPGKKGKEVGDTIIVVNSELVLYASFYKNGEYEGGTKVKWYWADTSYSSPTANDTTIHLGSGESITFKPTKSDTGFIFVEKPKKQGDSTGTITIVPREKLIFSPVYSAHTEITQGQQNILVTFKVENIGHFSTIIKDADLVMMDIDSQVVIDDYQISRIDTNTIIPAGQTKKFEFLVNVNSDADTGQFFIDGKLITEESFYTNFDQKHSWQVQSPPILNIELIHALIDEVFPGQEDVIVSMHVSNKGGASVDKIKAELLFWRNGIDVADEYAYKMSENNLQTIEGDSTAIINLIVSVKPSAAFGTVIINGNIFASDVNTGIVYSDMGAYIPASWRVQLTTAQVGIMSTKVKCPNLIQTGDGEVNLKQSFAVEVTVKNQGKEEINNIGITLITDGHSIFKNNHSQVIQSLSKDQLDKVNFSLVANTENIPTFENFTARIDSATAASGRLANISSSLDSLAQVKIVYPAHLQLQLDTTFLQIPVNQVFDVVARLKNAPENAGYDSSGTIQISLPDGYSLIADNPVQNFRENEEISWRVKSPGLPSESDSIIVFIKQRPRDKNNPHEYAMVEPDSVFLIVETLATYVEISDVSINAPAGAGDDTLSTEQWFNLAARIKKQKVKDVFAQVELPAGYSCDHQIQLIADDTTANWNIQAPTLTDYTHQKIIVSAWGNVENDTRMVYSIPDSSLSVLTVDKANLKIYAEIIHPPEALQGEISPGLGFQIKSDIINLGKAETYGEKLLKIQIQEQEKFTVLGDSILPVGSDSVVWTIRAAQQLAMPIKPIKIKINQVPFDENTDTTAFMREENKSYDVQLFTTPGITLLELMIRSIPGMADDAIAPNTSGTLMGIELVNLSPEKGFPIRINGLEFDVEDKNNFLITPLSAISGFRIKNNEVILGEASSFSQNPIEVSFTNPIFIDAQEMAKLTVEADFPENLSQQFRINLKDTSYIHLFSQFDVQIVNEQRIPTKNLNVCSRLPEITRDDLKGSFCNYPNPFGNPSRTQTHFIYYLPFDTDIDLKIYTLLGELVWKCSFSRNQPQGKKGLHQKGDITWNGKNLKGYTVLNGVYIARIETGYGDRAMTKVAVIK